KVSRTTIMRHARRSPQWRRMDWNTASRSSVEGAEGVGDVVMTRVNRSDTGTGVGGAGQEDDMAQR
ncbi:hypothetical protein CH063_03842, partial [Colletotrichum higginsianum]